MNLALPKTNIINIVFSITAGAPRTSGRLTFTLSVSISRDYQLDNVRFGMGSYNLSLLDAKNI